MVHLWLNVQANEYTFRPSVANLASFCLKNEMQCRRKVGNSSIIT